MAEEPNDYYEQIREKITDPEIQKALDAFHARGAAERSQAKEAAAPAVDERRESAVPPLREGNGAQAPEGERRAAPGAGRRLDGEGMRPQNAAMKMPSKAPSVPNNGQYAAGTGAPRTRDASLFRQYMRTPERQSVYTDRPVYDAYEAAYRASLQKASDGRAANAGGKRLHFAVGLLVTLFAVFGLGCAVFFSVRGVAAHRAKKEEEKFAAYNEKLLAVAAVDPDAFDDVSAARMEDLIKIAVWRLIGAGVDPNRYVYANGELCLPQTEVEAAYTACFGAQVPIAHRTVEGYGYTAQYSEEDAAYYIPMTTLEPLYTPKVVSVETKGGAAVVTCGLISSGLWKQDRVTGDIVAPEPDKYLRVTFRMAAGAEYISSLQSLGLPETALLPEAAPAAPAETQTSPPPAETTTEKQIVITWD